MELIRFYCKPITKPSVELSGAEAHHLSSVRRLTIGDKVELFDGTGSVATATIATTANKSVSLRIDKIETFPKPPQEQIVIAVSIAKGDRFDWMIEKCTELGVLLGASARKSRTNTDFSGHSRENGIHSPDVGNPAFRAKTGELEARTQVEGISGSVAQ